MYLELFWLGRHLENGLKIQIDKKGHSFWRRKKNYFSNTSWIKFVLNLYYIPHTISFYFRSLVLFKVKKAKKKELDDRIFFLVLKSRNIFERDMFSFIFYLSTNAIKINIWLFQEINIYFLEHDKTHNHSNCIRLTNWFWDVIYFFWKRYNENLILNIQLIFFNHSMYSIKNILNISSPIVE